MNEEKIENEVIEENNDIIEEQKSEVIEPEVMFSIKNNSTFSKEGYFQMNKEVAKRSYPLFVVAILAFIGIDVYLYFQSMWVFAITLSVFVVLFPFLLKFLSNSQLNRSFNIYNTSLGNMSYEYTFENDKISIKLESKDGASEGELLYSSIYNIIENKDFLFIFISANQSYIVEKKGFEDENDIKIVVEHLKSKGIKYSLKTK